MKHKALFILILLEGCLFSVHIHGMKNLLKEVKSLYTNRKDKSGYTPLQHACVWGKIEKVKWLLKNGADPNKTDESESIPLCLACRYGYFEIAKLLLKNGAYVNSGWDKTSPFYWACYWASKRDNIKIVKLLLDYETNANNWSYLEIACKYGYFEIVKLLLKNNAYVHTSWDRESLFYWACYWACRCNNIKEIKLLLDYEANTDNWNHLEIAACKKGYRELLELLLKKLAQRRRKIPLNYKEHWQNLLTVACRAGNKEIVELLLNSGAREFINKTDKDESTLLHLACRVGNKEIIELLLKNGARESINKTDKNEYTPLYWACNAGNRKIVELLLKNGAKAEIIKTKDGYTILRKEYFPLNLACRKGNREIAELLLKNGANANRRPSRWPPLYWACIDKQPEIVKLLLKNGAKVTDEYMRKDWNKVTKSLLQTILNFNKLKTSKKKIEFIRNQSNKKTKNILVSRAMYQSAEEIIKNSEHMSSTLFFDMYKKAKVDNDLKDAIARSLSLGKFKSLFTDGADVDKAKNPSEVLLYQACCEGSWEIAEFLLTNGARETINNVDVHGKTILSNSCHYNYKEIMKWLIANGANVEKEHILKTSLSDIKNILQVTLDFDSKNDSKGILEFIKCKSKEKKIQELLISRTICKAAEKIIKKSMPIKSTSFFDMYQQSKTDIDIKKVIDGILEKNSKKDGYFQLIYQHVKSAESFSKNMKDNRNYKDLKIICA